MRNAWPRHTWILLASALAAGCTDQSKVAPTRGTVTLDGKPLPGGRVMFEPIATGESKLVGKAAFGQIQPDGSFVLTTYKDGDGALVGSHHPIVLGNRQEDPRVENPKRPTIPGPNLGVVRLEDRTFDVIAGQENVFRIELSSRRDLREAVRDD